MIYARRSEYSSAASAPGTLDEQVREPGAHQAGHVVTVGAILSSPGHKFVSLSR